MSKPTVTLRIGAAHYDVTVDGRTFDLSAMKRPARNKLSRLLVGGLESAGYFKKETKCSTVTR